MNDSYIEKCMIKTAVESKDFLITISAVYIPEYFNDVSAANIFIFLRDHIKEYNVIPDKEVIINSIPDSESISNYFKEIESMDYNTAKNYDWLFQQSNEYLKEKALQKAVMDVADIIEKKDNIYQSRSIIEEALCKDMKISLGHDYWGDMQERLKRLFTTEDPRIPTYYPQLDSYLNGGFPKKTLAIFIARIHGWKSQFMANIMARQVLYGKHTVALASLEMSEDMFSQRFDGIYSNLDINKIYYNSKVRKEFLSRISEVRKKEKGDLFIKEYPTGAATINDFRMWLRELEMRGKKPSIFYFDYISLVKSMGKEKGLYEDKKAIAEEARALGYEFNIPVVSVSQINRCLDINTIVDRKDSNEKIEKVFIKDLEIGDDIKTDGGFNKVLNKWDNNNTDIYRVTLKNGKTIDCSLNHRYPCYDYSGNCIDVFTIKDCYDKGYYLKTFLMLSKIEKIEKVKTGRTIDITTSGNNLFYANGILTHNSGSFLPLEDIDFNYIQESVGVAATADFCSVSGNNEDDMVYESEIWYKIIKNRLGGMVGSMNKFFFDQRSLKMYDADELDLWIKEATLSGDTRDNKKKK